MKSFWEKYSKIKKLMIMEFICWRFSKKADGNTLSLMILFQWWGPISTTPKIHTFRPLSIWNQNKVKKTKKSKVNQTSMMSYRYGPSFSKKPTLIITHHTKHWPMATQSTSLNKFAVSHAKNSVWFRKLTHKNTLKSSTSYF